LPYNYTLAFQNNQTGAPLMRPLFFEEPENKVLQEDDSFFLWGNSFLIAPITISKVEKKVVYFPKKSHWFDFYTDEKYQGGQTKVIPVHENYIPTFVRAGAFIPMANPMQSTVNYDANNFKLHYYHDSSIYKSNGQLYDDDGKTTNAFEKGEYEILSFNSRYKKRLLAFEFNAKKGVNHTLKNKTIDFIIHNIQKKPKRIKIGSKRKVVRWNETNNTVTIPISWNANEPLKLNIKL